MKNGEGNFKGSDWRQKESEWERKEDGNEWEGGEKEENTGMVGSNGVTWKDLGRLIPILKIYKNY